MRCDERRWDTQPYTAIHSTIAAHTYPHTLRRTKTDSEDELLLKMAEELGIMVPNMVPPADASPIIEILEVLCGVEETVVRTAAVAALSLIIPHMYDHNGAAVSGADGSLVNLVTRLCGSEWFTGRVSACGLFGSVYKGCSFENKTELRRLFGTMAEDETPMVRRGAAKGLPSFIIAAGANSSDVLDDLVPIYKKLASDEQDSVRTIAVGAVSSLGLAVKNAGECYAQVFPQFRNGAQDRSWRVRHAVATTFTTDLLSLGFADAQLTEMVLCYADLLKDGEAEVRGSAVSAMSSMVEAVGETLFQDHIAECLDDLSKDPVMECRSKLAQAVMNTIALEAPAKLTDDTVLTHFQPLIEGLLTSADEADEVKIHILRMLPAMASLLSNMDDTVAVVKTLSKYDANWRVRECVALVLPALANANGIGPFSDGTNSFLNIYLALLQDPVASVRAATVSGVHKLYEAACAEEASKGASWVQKSIIDPIKPTYDGSLFYTTRVTILALYATLCPDDATPKALLEEIVGLLLSALDDPVTNVRTSAAEHLVGIVGFCNDALIAGEIRPKIMKVGETIDLDKNDEFDKDQDMRGFLKKLVVCMDS